MLAEERAGALEESREAARRRARAAEERAWEVGEEARKVGSSATAAEVRRHFFPLSSPLSLLSPFSTPARHPPTNPMASFAAATHAVSNGIAARPAVPARAVAAKAAPKPER